ncbi:MAG: hypothetical protein AAF223_10565, partial [Bacteroidota bacterium]
NILGLDFAVRYYYALPRRIKRGKSANNLSANYFSIQSRNSWIGVEANYPIIGTNPTVYTSEAIFSRNNSFSILYGLQRRLGKYGYIDANLGYFYNPSFRNDPFRENWEFNIEANFSIGVAF